jgi:hypothetical protein
VRTASVVESKTPPDATTPEVKDENATAVKVLEANPTGTCTVQLVPPSRLTAIFPSSPAAARPVAPNVEMSRTIAGAAHGGVRGDQSLA